MKGNVYSFTPYGCIILTVASGLRSEGSRGRQISGTRMGTNRIHREALGHGCGIVTHNYSPNAVHFQLGINYCCIGAEEHCKNKGLFHFVFILS